VARDVAGGARVGVGPPGAAHPGVLLDDQEVLALLLQPDGQGHTGEAGADDQVVDVGGQGHPANATESVTVIRPGVWRRSCTFVAVATTPNVRDTRSSGCSAPAFPEPAAGWTRQ